MSKMQLVHNEMATSLPVGSRLLFINLRLRKLTYYQADARYERNTTGKTILWRHFFFDDYSTAFVYTGNHKLGDMGDTLNLRATVKRIESPTGLTQIRLSNPRVITINDMQMSEYFQPKY